MSLELLMMVSSRMYVAREINTSSKKLSNEGVPLKSMLSRAGSSPGMGTAWKKAFERFSQSVAGSPAILVVTTSMAES